MGSYKWGSMSPNGSFFIVALLITPLIPFMNLQVYNAKTVPRGAQVQDANTQVLLLMV